jgi:hypothetical protein
VDFTRLDFEGQAFEDFAVRNAGVEVFYLEGHEKKDGIRSFVETRVEEVVGVEV